MIEHSPGKVSPVPGSGVEHVRRQNVADDGEDIVKVSAEDNLYRGQDEPFYGADYHSQS